MSPEVTTGPRTTADSSAEGRIKVDAGQRNKKRKFIFERIKKTSVK